MLEKIKHVNSLGKVMDFKSLGIYANYNDLRDYEWQVVTTNNQIKGFTKGIVKKTIPFVFCVNQEKAQEIKNKFYEHFDVDVQSCKEGYFEINGYKLYCFVTKNVKSDYLVSNHYLKITLEITCSKADWIRELTHTYDFRLKELATNLKYPFKYSYTYSSKKQFGSQNPTIANADFILRIYGPISNPAIKIGSDPKKMHTYQVFENVGENEYLEIDSNEKTILKYDNLGKVTNAFNKRSKTDDVFRKIDAGYYHIASTSECIIDLVLIEKRGEPKWI